MADGKTKRRMLNVFEGESLSPPPVWLMRQAGRYLPEYRKTRAEAGSFLNLCYSPKMAAEVTLQPIRRYGFDASILFSDILVVPDALGQTVRFLEGEGPKLDPITTAAELIRLKPAATKEKFGLVCETVARLRQDLPAETTLIGFCGAPFTVATYMVAGEGSSDQAATRAFAYRDPQGFGQLLDIVTTASIDYLCQQIKAGADVIQIFDSWAGNLPDDEFTRWIIEPTAKLVAGVKLHYPHVPIIGFPRGGAMHGERYVAATGVQGIGCDTAVPLSLMAKGFGKAIVQGNLDPLLLVAGGAALERRTREILAAMKGRPFIFNLGHGIVPHTPPEHVAQLMQIIRGG